MQPDVELNLARQIKPREKKDNGNGGNGHAEKGVLTLGMARTRLGPTYTVDGLVRIPTVALEQTTFRNNTSTPQTASKEKEEEIETLGPDLMTREARAAWARGEHPLQQLQQTRKLTIARCGPPLVLTKSEKRLDAAGITAQFGGLTAAGLAVAGIINPLFFLLGLGVAVAGVGGEHQATKRALAERGL